MKIEDTLPNTRVADHRLVRSIPFQPHREIPPRTPRLLLLAISRRADREGLEEGAERRGLNLTGFNSFAGAVRSSNLARYT